jgi:hypothetical protein
LTDNPSYRFDILDEPLSLLDSEVEADDSGGLDSPEGIGERYDMTLFYLVDDVTIRWKSLGVAEVDIIFGKCGPTPYDTDSERYKGSLFNCVMYDVGDPSVDRHTKIASETSFRT